MHEDGVRRDFCPLHRAYKINFLFTMEVDVENVDE